MVADGGMLSPPAVLDVCALYGRSNPGLVAGLLRSLGDLEGGAVGVRLAGGLEETGVAAARALAEVHAKVGGALDRVGVKWVGNGIGLVGFLSALFAVVVRVLYLCLCLRLSVCLSVCLIISEYGKRQHYIRRCHLPPPPSRHLSRECKFMEDRTSGDLSRRFFRRRAAEI